MTMYPYMLLNWTYLPKSEMMELHRRGFKITPLDNEHGVEFTYSKDRDQLYVEIPAGWSHDAPDGTIRTLFPYLAGIFDLAVSRNAVHLIFEDFTNGDEPTLPIRSLDDPDVMTMERYSWPESKAVAA